MTSPAKIHKESWYLQVDNTPDPQEVATTIWGELLTRDPKAELSLADGTLDLSLKGFELSLTPLAEETLRIEHAGGYFEDHPDLVEEYGLQNGAEIKIEDLFRFIIDMTEETTWADQVAGKKKKSGPKYLVKDKRSGEPNKSKLEVKPFRPHFDTGPTYYGIVDTTNMSWLKDHEYETEKEAKKALAECKKGKTPLEFRGF